MNKKIIISLASLLISLALVFISISPLWSSVRNLRLEVAQEKTDLAKIEELLDKTQQLKQELQEVEEESQRIFFALPKEKDIPNLLIQFETLALTNGLLLELIRFGKIDEPEKGISSQRLSEQSPQEPVQPTKKLALRSLPVDLIISGSYSAFKKYLADLEKNIRSMDVHSIRLTTPTESGEVSILTPSLGIFGFDLGLVVYYQ